MEKTIKHEWKRAEKIYYQPKNFPTLVNIPEFAFFSIKGKGNPNDPFFAEYIEVLYTLSYAVKMSPKQGIIPEGYYDYTVYPLEGVWDIDEEAKKNFSGSLDKNSLQFSLMIRQPSFVTPDFATKIIEKTKKKKQLRLIDQVKFEKIEEKECIQMLHIGSYDNESASFQIMEDFATLNQRIRLSKTHREIYLSDARKTEQDKLNTILRFQLKP